MHKTIRKDGAAHVTPTRLAAALVEHFEAGLRATGVFSSVTTRHDLSVLIAEIWVRLDHVDTMHFYLDIGGPLERTLTELTYQVRRAYEHKIENRLTRNWGEFHVEA